MWQAGIGKLLARQQDLIQPSTSQQHLESRQPRQAQLREVDTRQECALAQRNKSAEARKPALKAVPITGGNIPKRIFV